MGGDHPRSQASWANDGHQFVDDEQRNQDHVSQKRGWRELANKEIWIFSTFQSLGHLKSFLDREQSQKLDKDSLAKMDGPKSIIKRSYTAIFFQIKFLFGSWMFSWSKIEKIFQEDVQNMSVKILTLNLISVWMMMVKEVLSKTLLFFHICILEDSTQLFQDCYFFQEMKKRIEILNQHLFFWTDGPQNINTLFC